MKVVEIGIDAMRDLLKRHPKMAQSLEGMVDGHEKKIAKNMFMEG